jgi:FAD synthase
MVQQLKEQLGGNFVSIDPAAPVADDEDGTTERVAFATVTGRVVSGFVALGDQRGRQIGFPTANLVLAPDDSRVRDGVYAGTFTTDGVLEHPAAVSVGRRPTIYVDGVRLLEAHLMDFSGNLYGQLASVRLVKFLRPQHRFDDLPSLIRQLAKDVVKTRSILRLT